MTDLPWDTATRDDVAEELAKAAETDREIMVLSPLGLLWWPSGRDVIEPRPWHNDLRLFAEEWMSIASLGVDVIRPGDDP